MRTIVFLLAVAGAIACRASFVEITPSTCTAYLATCPANSNLICGVGMGKEAGYTFVRGEDIDWMAEATIERCWAAVARDRFRRSFSQVIHVWVARRRRATLDCWLPPTTRRVWTWGPIR